MMTWFFPILQGNQPFLNIIKKLSEMKLTIIMLAALMLSSCNHEASLLKIEEELMSTDIEFSDMSVEKGFDQAFVHYCADDGVLLRPNNLPIVGKEAVGLAMKEARRPGLKLSWEPSFVNVAKSGELGYTYGIYSVKSSSDSLLAQGTYVTIWEKNNGAWKFKLDSGNEGLGE
jgi:ketosteroid isomerase-like protein